VDNNKDHLEIAALLIAMAANLLMIAEFLKRWQKPRKNRRRRTKPKRKNRGK
jgi:hypothetical protein